MVKKYYVELAELDGTPMPGFFEVQAESAEAATEKGSSMCADARERVLRVLDEDGWPVYTKAHGYMNP